MSTSTYLIRLGNCDLIILPTFTAYCRCSDGPVCYGVHRTIQHGDLDFDFGIRLFLGKVRLFKVRFRGDAALVSNNGAPVEVGKLPFSFSVPAFSFVRRRWENTLSALPFINNRCRFFSPPEKPLSYAVSRGVHLFETYFIQTLALLTLELFAHLLGKRLFASVPKRFELVGFKKWSMPTTVTQKKHWITENYRVYKHIFGGFNLATLDSGQDSFVVLRIFDSVPGSNPSVRCLAAAKTLLNGTSVKAFAKRLVNNARSVWFSHIWFKL